MHYYLARALCKCIYEYNLFLKRWCPCSGTISMEPHRVDVSWKTTNVQKREEEGRKKEERKKEKLSISSPVTVLSNHSSSSSAWPKPIQFQFRFSQTNPVPFRFTIMLDESEWESYCEERAGDPEDLRFSYCKIPEVATLLMQGMVSVDTIGLDQ